MYSELSSFVRIISNQNMCSGGLTSGLLAINAGYTVPTVTLLFQHAGSTTGEIIRRRNFVHSYVGKSFATIAMLKILLNYDPHALESSMVTNGTVPLHHAASSGPPSLVGYISEKSPSTCSASDMNDEIPIFFFLN